MHGIFIITKFNLIIKLNLNMSEKEYSFQNLNIEECITDSFNTFIKENQINYPNLTNNVLHIICNDYLHLIVDNFHVRCMLNYHLIKHSHPYILYTLFCHLHYKFCNYLLTRNKICIRNYHNIRIITY